MTAYILFILTHIIILLSSINANAITVAFPEITSHFNASLVTAGWVLSIYQLMAVATVVLAGKICDIYGRKNVYLASTGLYLGGCFLCAIAPNIYLLIAARFIQSIGAAGLMPSIVGIIIILFPHSRQKAIGLSMSFFTVGGIIGPNIGAWLMSNWGWQSIFWFNLPIGILAALPIIFLFKTDRGQSSHIDYPGAGLLTGAIFAFMFGISQLSSLKSVLNWVTLILLFAAAAIFTLLFVRQERKVADPVVDLSLITRRPFSALNCYNIVFGACVFGVSSFVPMFAIKVYNMTPLESSLILSIRSIGMILALILSSFFIMRWGYRRPMLIGSILICLTMLAMGLEPPGLRLGGILIGALVLLCAINALFGIGMGLAVPASSNACLDQMPERAPTIIAINGMFRQGGGAFDIALTTLVLQLLVNLTLGFEIIFIASAALMLITVPFIFLLPARPSAPQTSRL
jgi:MFS family permease